MKIVSQNFQEVIKLAQKNPSDLGFTPYLRSDCRIDDTSHPRREDDIASELESLGNAAGDDGSCGDAESPLEEPTMAQLLSRIFRKIHQENSDACILP